MTAIRWLYLEPGQFLFILLFGTAENGILVEQGVDFTGVVLDDHQTLALLVLDTLLLQQLLHLEPTGADGRDVSVVLARAPVVCATHKSFSQTDH